MDKKAEQRLPVSRAQKAEGFKKSKADYAAILLKLRESSITLEKDDLLQQMISPSVRLGADHMVMLLVAPPTRDPEYNLVSLALEISTAEPKTYLSKDKDVRTAGESLCRYTLYPHGAFNVPALEDIGCELDSELKQEHVRRALTLLKSVPQAIRELAPFTKNKLNHTRLLNPAQANAIAQAMIDLYKSAQAS